MTRLTRCPVLRAFALVAASTIASCSTERTESSEAVSLTAADTLVSTASELIGGAQDVSIAPDGDLHVADARFKHVLVVASDGTVRRTIGKAGEGPGEFVTPLVVQAGSDSVRVFDARTSLVQVFDREGGFGRSVQVEIPGLGSRPDFREDGSLAAATSGADGSMIIIADAAGNRVTSFGDPIVPPTSFFDFTAIKAEIRDGRVPDAFRNGAQAVAATDGSVYLVFQSEPQVRRYDGQGTLLWTVTLDEPALTSARERFFQKNREEQNPSAIHSLQYVTDAEVVDGDLWLLLNTLDATDGQLLVLNGGDGAMRRRITFTGLPNTGPFAVDAERRRLYMAPRDDASIIVYELAMP